MTSLTKLNEERQTKIPKKITITMEVDTDENGIEFISPSKTTVHFNEVPVGCIQRLHLRAIPTEHVNTMVLAFPNVKGNWDKNLMKDVTRSLEQLSNIRGISTCTETLHERYLEELGTNGVIDRAKVVLK